MLRSSGQLITSSKGPAIFGPTQNLLLRMLPPHELSSLLSEASNINLQPGTILQNWREEPAYVHFPMSGIVSLDIVMRSQQSVEAALVGHNSAVGLLAGLGIAYAPARATVQAPGRAIRIPMKAFRAATRSPVVRDMVVKGVALLFWETQQNVACSAAHDVQSRLCRWLLRCHDFCNGEAIPLTQDFLAQMLAVRRTTITLAASTLQDAGVIQYRRGVIQVLDREGLEQRSCECREVIADHVRRVVDVKSPQS
jgi:CRP-like cAMP-binding protein